MNENMVALAAGALGAFVQELAYWHVLRKRLSKPEYQATLRSGGYWMVTVLMIGASAVGAWLWFLPELETPRSYLLTGAAFPMLVKRAIAVFTQDESKLGTRTDGVRKYLTAA
jgi:hypothetical protein